MKLLFEGSNMVEYWQFHMVQLFPELKKFIMQSAQKKLEGYKNSIWSQTFSALTIVNISPISLSWKQNNIHDEYID